MLILEAENLKKNYNQKDNTNKASALNGINLRIKEGEFVGIMGPSGSGKTTLLNILSGVDKATSGKIEILGENINFADEPTGNLDSKASRTVMKYFEKLNVSENGITEKEISKNISKELKVLFFFPCVLGVIIGSYYI